MIVETNALPIVNGHDALLGYRGITHDISRRTHNQRALKLSHRFLEIGNRNNEMPVLLRESLEEIKQFTGCPAAGIRILNEQGDIPYQAYYGFSREFYELESPLSIKTDQCMCIDVMTQNKAILVPRWMEVPHKFYKLLFLQSLFQVIGKKNTYTQEMGGCELAILQVKP